MVQTTETFRHRAKHRLIKTYKALYYGYFGCAPALWKRFLPGAYRAQVIYMKSNGNCLAYHTVTKTGSTTVKSLLLDAIGDPIPESGTEVHLTIRRYRYSNDLWRQRVSSGNYLIFTKTINGIPPRLKIPPEFDRALHFTFVRNPWARLASCYADKVLAMPPHQYEIFKQHYPLIRFERMTFTDFVRFVCRVPDDLCEPHFAPQCCFLNGYTLDFVGRVERFADDLAEIIRLGGLDERLLKWAQTKRNRTQSPGHRSRSGSAHYTDLYTTQTRNLVARKYAEDIDRFGYRFGD